MIPPLFEAKCRKIDLFFAKIRLLRINLLLDTEFWCNYYRYLIRLRLISRIKWGVDEQNRMINEGRRPEQRLDTIKKTPCIYIYTGCFFYVLSYSIWPHAFILGSIWLIDLSISSHYHAQSDEGLLIILSLLCVEQQANT